MNRVFIEKRVPNLHAQSNAAMSLRQMYVIHEKSEKREYSDLIQQIVKGIYSQVVLSCSEGASPETSNLLKRIAMKLVVKRKEKYYKN